MVRGISVALAIGLVILWIIGLAMHAEVWLTWWTFAFAMAFLLVGIGAGMQERPAVEMRRPHTV